MSNKKGWGSYRNIMNFPINFRAIWLEGSPALKIQPGQTIDGPHEYLSAYRFFAPVNVNMHKVSSIINDQNGDFQDIGEDSEEIIKLNENDVVEYDEPDDNQKVEITPEILESLPLKIGDKAIWLRAKNNDLEACCEILNIDIPDHIEKDDKKKRKWELVNLVKKAIGEHI